MPPRRPTRQLAQLFDQSPLPIYLLDDARRIVYCNAACAAWLAIPAEDLVGQTCNYETGETAEGAVAAAAALCPPPSAFLGELTSANVMWKNAAGVLEQRQGTFLPLGGQEPDATAVVAILGEAQTPASVNGALADVATASELHLRLQQLVREQRKRYRLDRLVGDSPAIRRVRAQVQLAIQSHARVLITGPKGSGREHIARTIHGGEKPDSAGPLLPLACDTLNAEILQATILAFLRRCEDQPGKVPGTLLLLDADRLSKGAQAELLSFFRVPTFGMRTLATARRPLLALAEQGKFLPELAFSLSTLVIELPPLGERREDIPLLVQQMVEEFNAAGGKQLAGFSPAAMDRLAAMPWLGNVEELVMVVREAIRNVSTVWIGEADLPSHVRAVESAGAHPPRASERIKLDAFLLEIERELIQRAMKRSQGNKASAARLLGISRARLLRRLSQLGLDERVEPQIEFQLIEDDDVPQPTDSTDGT